MSEYKREIIIHSEERVDFCGREYTLDGSFFMTHHVANDWAFRFLGIDNAHYFAKKVTSHNSAEGSSWPDTGYASDAKKIMGTLIECAWNTYRIDIIKVSLNIYPDAFGAFLTDRISHTYYSVDGDGYRVLKRDDPGSSCIATATATAAATATTAVTAQHPYGSSINGVVIDSLMTCPDVAAIDAQPANIQYGWNDTDEKLASILREAEELRKLCEDKGNEEGPLHINVRRQKKAKINFNF